MRKLTESANTMVIGVSVLSAALLTAAAQERPSSPPARADGSPSAPHPTEKVDFRREVLPLLADKCFACHGPDANQRQADLRLDQRQHATRPLLSGRTAVVPGQPSVSELVRRLHADSDERMPPLDSGKSLQPAEIQILERWITQGANYTEHWSFVPPQRPAVPPARDAARALNAVDHFILARLDAEQLSPSPRADRRTLIRRATLDLTGLPPAPDEIDAFVADCAPNAWEKVVDRLLASPRFGEQMARDWLDQARYADTHGYFTDHERFMWRWRDWVIQAFNANMPFDQFTVEQLAGDLLPKATIEQRIATGFHRNHMVTEETGVIPEEYRTEYVADRVRTTGAVWLGLTVGCAQCHDHKYDPLSQREFYQLFAFFNNLPEEGISGGRKNAAPILEIATPEEKAELARLREQIAAVEKQLKEIKDAAAATSAATSEPSRPVADSVDPRRKLEAERDQLRERERELLLHGTVMVMQELEKPRETYLLVRGQYDQRGEQVEAGVPSVLPALPPRAPANRLGLARWLVDPQHPLTARVAANRLWRQLLGQGLVATVEDFGVQGELPSHPELLDWLASELVATGWDVKRTFRTILLSATYQQSSRVIPEQRNKDPRNRWLARAPRYRLDAEVIRDSALFTSGLLVERLGGPSVKPYQPADLWKHITYDTKNTQHYDQSTGDGLFRRSLYTYWKRQVPPPTMQLLDAPTRETCVLRRQRTNTPLQALALLNETQFVEAARVLGERMYRASPCDDERIRFGFRLVVSRSPAADELLDLKTLLGGERNEQGRNVAAARQLLAVGATPVPSDIAPTELAAWTVVANALLNLDEALTRE